jgi:CHAT domain-containing protein
LFQALAGNAPAVARCERPWVGASVALLPTRRIVALYCTLLAALLACSPTPASATTWIEQAQADLTCTGQADDAERLALDAAWLPQPLNAASITSYFQGKPRDADQARFRYLTVLAAIGWWADLINDQALRSDVYASIGALADRYVAGTDSLLYRQIARCARARLISAALEQDQPQIADRLAESLARLYPDAPPAQSVADWPLIVALREIRLDPRSRAGITALTTLAVVYAGSPARTRQPERASRLLAAAAEGLLALGETDKARQVALQSIVMTGKPPAADAAWRAMPTIYDAVRKLNGAADAAKLHALLQPDRPPSGLRDQQAAFESLLRLAEAAETERRFEDMGRLAAEAFRGLANLGGVDRYSMPFFRHALDELAGTRDADIGTLARRDPNFAAATLATYTGLYDTLLRQAQGQFVAEAREQLLFQFKIDNDLHALTELDPAMPRSSTQIADTSFRLAQLRSFGRLTLATLSAELGRSSIDPQSRFGVERFFTLSTQTAVWLRGLFGAIRTAPDAAPPDGEALWKVFFTLDVFYNETTKEFERYTAFVRQKAPGAAELATPRPLPVRDFQRRLRAGEAIVATLVTPRDLYVWAITQQQVVVSRQRVTEREVREIVRRLRAGLVPGSGSGAGGLPPFDAAAAYDLYRLIFAPIAAALTGVTDIAWYGHGPLGSVPPAVLVAEPPVKPTLSTPAEFAATRFLVDRYAFSALADLSLFAWHRDKATAGRRDDRFLGVGAPLLSAEELAGAPRSRSYELAGGLDGKELSELPKLAESADEMRGLAAVVGESQSTLWLGPEASERRFVGDALRGYETIALATHGFLPGEVRDVPEPALMLALDPASRDRFDGILTSREIAGLQLDANLVILSACNTASPDGRPRGETFTGLSQAFFTAGARSLMVSHWPVMSGAAVQLTVATLAESRSRKLSLARSLKLAMQEARRSGAASPVESHPSYWGPFVIVGDGR